MSYIGSKEWFHEVYQGNIQGWSQNRKFGRNTAIATSTVPIAASGVYQTPTTAQSLEIVSSSTLDTSAGLGARQVTVIGLNSSWIETTEVVTMNGTTPVALSNTFIRVYRMYVSSSGTYATSSTSSQDGTITLRNSGAGVTWAVLNVEGGLGLGQSLIGAYTIPADYSYGYVYLNYISVESTKAVTAYFFKRENADDVTSPYSGMNIQAVYDSVAGFTDFGDTHFLGKFPAKTDVGFMAKVSSGTAAVSVEFKIYLKI